ncbi:undecaprenyl diphosphate synthase family protein [bacterium]|nr:undecaprenyl diphosphate synthase family protein [bacterium]
MFGHQQGAKVIKHLIDYALNDYVKYLTLFCFSLEN